MTQLWAFRQKAEAAYKVAVAEWKADPSVKNEQRVRVRLALLDGLKRWMVMG